jgi:signal transduction histidine kinase
MSSQSSRKKAKKAFASALILLLLCGIASLAAISRFSDSSQWVMHTYQVQVASAAVENALSDSARYRLSYITWGDPAFIEQYQQSKNEVYTDLSRVRDLTRDNSLQQRLFGHLQMLADDRIKNLQSSIDARMARQQDDELQDSAMNLNTRLANETAKVINDMQDQENALLQARKYSSSLFFDIMLWILGAMLASSVYLFWIHYRLLSDELSKREQAESGARRLSAHVLELQDEERRKFSRELHDSLGQNLAVAKMIAFGVSERHPKEESVPELVDLLDRSLQETRTLSHLLHPPLLDELGIASAVSWYVDGFSQRSGLKISLKISDGIGRLSRPAELVLFRVLQESLTNVHRHAKSPKADVALSLAEGDVVLQVRDYGIGITAEKLHHFRSNGTQVGVGLTGMRERVREQGGQFEIYSGETGTEVLVTIPLSSAKRMEEEVATAQGAD